MSLAKPLYRRVFESPSFLAATLFLAIAATGWSVTIRWMGMVLAKADVPLIKSLDELPESFGDRFVLAREVNTSEIRDGKELMTKDVEETLGTPYHISWYYRDVYRSSAEASLLVRVHVAYYTNLLDPVPHVPDTCYVAGGFRSKGKPVDVAWRLPNLPAEWQSWKDVLIRQASFVRTGRDGKEMEATVFYVFSVNCEPVRDRLEVRGILANPWTKYCYYAKIELTVIGNALPAVEEQAKECEAFLAAAAPTLLKHFPSAEDIRQLETGR
jgi:hypothetical protein